jgi:hypothetical protein
MSIGRDARIRACAEVMLWILRGRKGRVSFAKTNLTRLLALSLTSEGQFSYSMQTQIWVDL